MFVWSGKATYNLPEYNSLRDECKQFLSQRANGRFPAPTSIHILKEGESMARHFVSRLVPSHGDKDDEQRMNLSAYLIQQLRAKLGWHNQKCDSSYMYWLDRISKVDSNMTQQGTSLCE